MSGNMWVPVKHVSKEQFFYNCNFNLLQVEVVDGQQWTIIFSNGRTKNFGFGLHAVANYIKFSNFS